MKKEKTERELLEEISRKLDKLYGAIVIAGREQNEQIRILRQLDFEWGDVGSLVGLNADAARKRFKAIENGSGKPKGKRNREAPTQEEAI